MECCLGKEHQDHPAQPFLAKAQSRQDGPVPFPAESQKCLALGKRNLELKKLRKGGIKALLAAAAFSWEPLGGSGKFERLGAVKVSRCESGLPTNLTVAPVSLQAVFRGCGA